MTRGLLKKCAKALMSGVLVKGQPMQLCCNGTHLDTPNEDGEALP